MSAKGSYLSDASEIATSAVAFTGAEDFPLPAMLADVLSGSMLSKKCPAVIGFAVGEAFWLYSWLGVAAVFADRYRQ